LGIIGMLAIMGVIAKMLTVTGLSQTLSFMMVDLSGGNILLLLPLIFIVCIVMGMAVSTLVVYIMVSLLAAPALMEYGYAPHVSHFTVFYLAMLSGITPPVAVSVAVACGIAKSSFFSTGWEAVKIGMPLFLLPFVFLVKPEILAGNLTTMPVAFVQVFVGLSALTYSIHSQKKGFKGLTLRLFCAGIGSMGVFSSSPVVIWLCVGTILLLSFFHYFQQRKIAETEKTK